MYPLSQLALGLTLTLALTPCAISQTFSSQHQRFELQTIASDLEHPWGLAFLPDGGMLVTERAGRLRMIVDGQLVKKPISGLPDLVVAGQGGLLDVLLHPNFADNQTLFLSYAHRDRKGMTTRVARATLADNQLKDVSVIFEAEPRSGGGRHFAGRMAFDRAGHLYIPVGDRGDMDRAQDTADDAGGVHRITVDGEPVPGNPGLERSGINDTLFTWGNRNIQGMTVHPQTGEVWSHEHGPRGGDEINILSVGTNYGWPEITYGIDYSGLPITSETEKPGMAQPLHYWDPSIAPSGMAFYTGSLMPEWQGDLFVGALKMRKLVRLRIQDGAVIEEEDLLADLGARIREVRDGPDGALWILTDSPDGTVYRLAAPD